MTDPRMNQEPARKPTNDELVELAITTAIRIVHCLKAERVSKKSVCAECGTQHGIEVDPNNQPDIMKGVVQGTCCYCGAPTWIGFYYKTDEELLKSKPRKVYRASYSTKENPVSVPF